ncbi:MAG: hypothetical protein ACI8UO_004301 [Verrucomicrobiales bacterium]|jgi:hypothetical protein
MNRLTAIALTFLPAIAFSEEVDFSREVLPILSDACFQCHGPDPKQRKADLRLDLESGAKADVIKPGSSAESELFKRLTAHDPDDQMPPPKLDRALSDAQIETIRRWIDEGAPWGQHWAFNRIERPEVDFGGRNPIDFFIETRLKTEGITPNPPAALETQLRRLTLDLTGLPPTLPEQTAFQKLGYEKSVQHLLAKPAYGERMAWDWLDAARYADSNGYQGDSERTMWPWRDWVVKAFNSNMPWDEFTIQQLAGDLLPDATDEQILATGFCRNHMINGEGGRIAEENRIDYVMDMAETTGTVWLGLTVGCARCHDHKFDPISQADYYSLFAFYNQTPVTGSGRSPQTAPVLATPTPEQKKRETELAGQATEAQKKLNARNLELAKTQTDWEQQMLASEGKNGAWQTLKIASAIGRQKLTIHDDGSVLAGGPLVDKDTYEVEATATTAAKITAIRLEALNHDSLTGKGLSRAESGNFVLTDFSLSIDDTPVKIVSAEASFEQGGWPVKGAFDGDAKTGWAVYPGKTVESEQQAAFIFEKPLEIVPDKPLKIILRHDSSHIHHSLGRFRLSITTEPKPTLGGRDAKLIAGLKIAPDKRTKEQIALVASAHRETDSEHRRLKAEQEKAAKVLTAHRGSIPKVMVMEEIDTPRKTFILGRGLYNQPTEIEVSAAVPAIFQAAPTANRLDLARWLVSRENPLTARVTVNRFWQQIFGIGLVKTTNDFGVQGEFPTHPELLDWLAADFMESGWDVKRLVTTIVTSDAYRRSSRIDSPDVFERDPENRLLARGPRFRMPSWMIRDQALAASGLLVAEVGGKSVNGYQPPGIWEEATFGKKKYTMDSGDALYRRSLYTFWRRIVGPTMFFDAGKRQFCEVKSSRTNTPMHALTTLNDVTFVEAARGLAQRVWNSAAADDETRIRLAVRLVIGREADEAELKILKRGLERARTEFNAKPIEAEALLAVGDSKRDSAIPAIEHAALTSVCLGIVNLDEALSK